MIVQAIVKTDPYSSGAMRIVYLHSVLIGFDLNGAFVAIIIVTLLHLSTTYYAQLIGFGMPFATILGSIGSPITGHIREVTGSYRLLREPAIPVLMIGFVSLILARFPMHPLFWENRANVTNGN